MFCYKVLPSKILRMDLFVIV
ncbi:unnamed protein product [Bemisia tabaci]|uniref:Uncharacterized protein n=1 Tax=Bemisia tabaci TaxID=7038 RepID=A0A9P0F6K8_BEMTA|nr:unnamed protein product [Bemisia tabaci]